MSQTPITVVGNLTADPERFWSRVDRRGSGECWPWLRGTQSGGYGVHWLPGRQSILAHRAALIISTGEAPAGAHALHSCDNTVCCNPAHLRWGTHADNMRDMRERGRARAGRTLPDVCSASHDLTDPANILTSTRTEKNRTYTVHSCRECNRNYLAKRRAERKAA